MGGDIQCYAVCLTVHKTDCSVVNKFFLVKKNNTDIYKSDLGEQNNVSIVMQPCYRQRAEIQLSSKSQNGHAYKQS